MMSKPAPTRPKLDALIKNAIEAFNALPRAERKKMIKAQAESYGRSCVTKPGHRQTVPVATKANWIDRCAWIAGKLLDTVSTAVGLPEPKRDTDGNGFGLPHLVFMAIELRDRKLDSETKACRWLGWLQAGLVAHRLTTLEDMKELNLASGEIAPRMRGTDFQARCQLWLDLVTDGDPTDLPERAARFLEEALELVQSLGMTEMQAGALVGYVFARPAGEPMQEMGGAATTLAVLAQHVGLNMIACGERELERCWSPEVIAKIKGKRSRRHGRGPLPGTVEADLVPTG